MPVKKYGVWKAKPVSYIFQKNGKTPHLELKFSDGQSGQALAAINIKSGTKNQSQLVYWSDEDFKHPIVNQLEDLDTGFTLLQGTDEQKLGGLALDYIRGNLFQRQNGKILSHNIPGPNNDIIDSLQPIVDKSISRKATIYLYGSRFDNGNGNKGIHEVHINQGNTDPYQNENGVFQDGGFILHFNDHWEAVFIGFASQAIHTEDGPLDPGFPIPREDFLTWKDFLDPVITDIEVQESPVVISQALVNPPGPDNQPESNPETVSLKNRTAKAVDLSRWKIRNKDGQFEELRSDSTLSAKGSKVFEVPFCPLSNQGGLITLLNEQGLRVHGVSYTKAQVMQGGGVVSFNL
ncbi:hypothetical protein V500_00718 [Pseudogymnoascus sp. VKM F-4518 (FW-2643)]|nr:hypothetical protein V500_00718 [Pseudogymnoascus sp. VKM F-4518 (FW-2643)]